MYSKIILFYSVLCFVFVKCDLNKEEGATCEWDGAKGICVNKYRCFTHLDTRTEPKHSVCSQNGDQTIICCTDCQLVNDTRNAVITPTNDVVWKTGQKSFDRCLDYLTSLPYDCHSTYYSRVSREFNEDNKCHDYIVFGIGGPPAMGRDPVNEFPEVALLGYGDTVDSASWVCAGAIISERFVLTAAHCSVNAIDAPGGSPSYPVKYVAYGLIDRSTPAEGWEHVTVKRTILHPDYKWPSKYNDIALIETSTPIKFNKNVLPACLHVTDAEDSEATMTTWRRSRKESPLISNTLNHAVVKKYSKAECSVDYPARNILEHGFDKTTQLCYGDQDHSTRVYKGYSGAPLVITTQISWCVHTVVGVMSFNKGYQSAFEVYTRVSHYVPWIESIVWAE